MQNSKDIANSTEETRNREQFHKYWSQFDTVGLEFAYMLEGNYLLSESRQRFIQDGADSNDLKLKQWTSYLGIDMTMLELEDQFINLVNNIDKRIFNLVQRSRQEIKSNGQLTAKDIEIMKENAARNWRWLQNLSETIQRHLANASEYHLFYQSLLQFQLSIPLIGIAERLQMSRTEYDGNYEEANDIYRAIKNHLSQYFNWWQKIEALISQSRKLNPIELRIEKTDAKLPATMLSDYKDNNVTLYRGEKVFRFKNDTPQRWGIENIHQDQIREVPSVCLEICPPDINAIEDALLLRLDLLANWTTAIKEIGGVLMDYITNILEYWNRPNIDVATCRSKYNNRNSICQSLSTIESLLNNYWTGSPQLGFLQSRINELKVELELHDDSDAINEETHIHRNTMFIDVCPLVLEKHDEASSNSSLSKSETFIYQKRAINILISKYKELHKNWEMYKSLVENSSDLSFICKSKDGSRLFPDDLSRSEKLLSFLSADDQLAWSKYLELLIENKQSDGNRAYDKYPTINVLPRKLELKSKINIYDVHSGTQNSQIDVIVPAEKEMRFFQNQPISVKSDNVITSSVDISHYFSNSLLPNRQQIKMVSHDQNANPPAEKDLTKKFLNSTLQRSKSLSSQEPENRKSLNKSKSVLESCAEKFDNIYVNNPNAVDHIQSFYMVLNLPREDKISYIVDRRNQRQLTPSQAQAEGLCNKYYLEILDTDTNIRYHFHAALARGLVSLDSTNSHKLSDKSIISNEESFMKAVYKIDKILDPDQNVWISLREAVNRNVFNQRSGLLKTNKTDFHHIVNEMNSPNVRGRRIYHCNSKSLPPEMTIEIPRVL